MYRPCPESSSEYIHLRKQANDAPFKTILLTNINLNSYSTFFLDSQIPQRANYSVGKRTTGVIDL